MRSPIALLSGVLICALSLAACSASGSGGRQVAITQTDQGCTPESVNVTGGEKLQFVVKNESGSDIYELEGIEGTRLEEFVVPSGRTRKAGYTVPDGEGTYQLKCYVPSGPTTIIELVAGAGATADSN